MKADLFPPQGESTLTVLGKALELFLKILVVIFSFRSSFFFSFFFSRRVLDEAGFYFVIVY